MIRVETDSPESGPRRLFFKELRRKSMEGYLIMKTGQRIVVAAFGGALCLATSTGLSTAESWSPVIMMPLMAASFDAGAKHVVSYFLTSDGQCKLTLMIAERSRDEKDESAAQDLRLLVMVAAGRTARLDAGEGKALEFACKGDAQAMTATAVDRVALNHTAK